ncbi:MAG: 4-phosphoerythronate dehydrogenase [Bacteroidales bacterium]|nr:4-phosphoerythronate dehydrogenase [Bacteroidales bacterium]
MRIIADDKIPFLKGALEPFAEIHYLPGREITSGVVRDADALIIRTRTRCNGELLDGSGVKFIASATIGYDHIDTGYCNSAGIRWTNAPGCNSASVRQYMVSALLYLSNLKNLSLENMTLGVIGVGNVGTKVCGAAQVLGMKVLMNDPPRERLEGKGAFVHLTELLAHSDIVTLHVPLNRSGADRTLHLVDHLFIDRMKDGAVLINTSRGEVADTESVRQGMLRGKLSDVILDVFENEPLIDAGLPGLLTLATPHVAGYSADGKANGTMMAVQSVSRFFNLGIDDWRPRDVPAPAQPMLSPGTSGADLYPLLWEIYRQTYDISEDDERLRENPHRFDELREQYPLRREPESYTVKLKNGSGEIGHKLRMLGFSVKEDRQT